MYLSESDNSDLNGPESFVQALIAAAEYTFYPIGQALSLSSDDSDDYSEKALRVKDLIDFKANMDACSKETDAIIQIEWEVKTGLKDSRGTLADLQHNLAALGADITKRVAEAQAQEAAARKAAS